MRGGNAYNRDALSHSHSLSLSLFTPFPTFFSLPSHSDFMQLPIFILGVIHTHTYIHTYIYTYVHTHIYIYDTTKLTHTYTYTDTHTHTYIHTLA